MSGEISFFNVVAGTPGTVERVTSDEVLELTAVNSLTLTRFSELEISYYVGLTINFEFDVFLTCSEGGNGTGQKIIVLSNKDGRKKYLNLTEIYLYDGYEKRVSSKVSFDGEFEIEVALYNKRGEFYDIGNSQRVSYEKNYIVVLNYELNDQMDLVFKGVKNINEFK